MEFSGELRQSPRCATTVTYFDFLSNNLSLKRVTGSFAHACAMLSITRARMIIFFIVFVFYN